MQKLLLIAAAGAAGTAARYALSTWVMRATGNGFPWGTFAVNILGAFLFGLVWSLADERELLGPDTRTIILAGFMGGFTTFSTMMFESSVFVRDRDWTSLFLYLAGQNATGLLALFAGLRLGRP